MNLVEDLAHLRLGTRSGEQLQEFSRDIVIVTLSLKITDTLAESLLMRAAFQTGRNAGRNVIIFLIVCDMINLEPRVTMGGQLLPWCLPTSFFVFIG